MFFQFASSPLPNRQLFRFLFISLSALLVVTLAALSVRAWQMKTTRAAKQAGNSSFPVAAPFRSALPGRSYLNGKLALQPEADKQRRRLGQRFLFPGREISMLNGTLLTGDERYAVQIVRIQDDDDERLTIALSGQQEAITWSGLGGAKSNNNPANGNLRTIIERLALDSPDQFILAQLRGSAYFTVARAVRPAEAGDSNHYDGMVWDLVRISEPTANGQNKPQSMWRLFYINTSTGLIDRIVSQEQGATVTAELSNWVNQSGEIVPTRIIWKSNSQPLMDLSIANISHNQKQ
ncbi:MAG: hypothetical protein JST85_30855 [Acidobacteria bacterium]|nr:hypothetical protein [Acidobacteriota bacterium]